MLVIFFNAIELNTCPRTIHAKLEARNLTPITRQDVFNVLLNPFISDPQPVIDYATLEMGHLEEERKGMSTQEIRKLVEDVVSICLEIPCKVIFDYLGMSKPQILSQGNLLGHLEYRYEFVKDIVKEVVLKYHLTLDDLPPSDDSVACRNFEAKLGQDHTMLDMLSSSSHALTELGRATSDAEYCVHLEGPLRKGNSQDMEAGNSEGNSNLVCVF